MLGTRPQGLIRYLAFSASWGHLAPSLRFFPLSGNPGPRPFDRHLFVDGGDDVRVNVHRCGNLVVAHHLKNSNGGKQHHHGEDRKAQHG